MAISVGPYSNITFNTGTYSAVQSTVCAQINLASVGGTRGIHGLTCGATSSSLPTAAVLLDSSNNSVEDVRVMGFFNGIYIGSQAAATSNVLRNVFGDTSEPLGMLSPVNVVHLSSLHPVSDTAIVGVTNIGGSGTDSILDDNVPASLSDPYVAMYVLGQQESFGGSNFAYSRFTTSPNTASWVSGSAFPPTSGCTSHNIGSLYSSTSNSANSNLYVCKPSGNWAAVPHN